MLLNQVKEWFDCDDIKLYAHAKITVVEHIKVKCAGRYNNKVQHMKEPALEHDKRKNVTVMIWNDKGIEHCCRKLHIGWIQGKFFTHFLPWPNYDYEEHTKNIPGIDIVSGVYNELKVMRGSKQPVLWIAKQRNLPIVCLASQWYIISSLWLWLRQEQANIVSG